MKDNPYWVALSRHFTKDGVEHKCYYPMPYSDITDLHIDECRVYTKKKYCEEACELFNKLKGY